jgi:hypothetical protein
VQGYEKRLFVLLDSGLQALKLRPAKRRRPRRPGLEEGALALNDVREFHNKLGETVRAAYKHVKR